MTWERKENNRNQKARHEVGFFDGATNGNRTRNTGTTNRCDNRFTMVAMCEAYPSAFVRFNQDLTKNRPKAVA